MAEAAETLSDQLSRGWRGYVLIGLIALVSSLFGAARLPVMDRDEARFAQATRQMVESGDYVRIRIQQDDRNKKPIGIHWLQAAAVNTALPLTHADNAIWPYRLPSALGAMLAALATLWAGTALLGRKPAMIGSALFAACMLLGFEGMTAKTDAVLCGFTTLTLAALAQLYAGRAKRPRLLALLFWAALGCGVLIKGPITPLVALTTILALGCWEKRWAWMKPLGFWPGPLLMALIVAPWMIAIGLATNGQFFVDAVSQDLAPKLAGGQEGHWAPPGIHLALLPFLIFPATYGLPFAARLGWEAIRARRDDLSQGATRFLLAWIVPAFLLFEAAPTKLAHYTLPLFPAIALLCGAGMIQAMRERWGVWHAIGIALFSIAGAAIVALMAYGATLMPGDPESDMRRAATLALVGGACTAIAIVSLAALRRQTHRVAVLVLTTLALSYGLRAHVLPEARSLQISSEAVAALTRARLTPRPDRTLWSIGYRETSLVFMTGTSIRLATAEELGAGAHVGDALLVEQREAHAVAQALAARGFAFAASGPPVVGLNVGNGRRIALYVGSVRVAPSPLEFNGELAGDRPPDPEPPRESRRRGRR